jgi:uncharacterized protein YebE (UPF0316 family)
MTLFFIGILEMVIVTLWTEVVTKTRILASGLVTIVNILLWYYVLQAVVDDISNWRLIILYAFGCALGTVLTTAYFSFRKSRYAKKLVRLIKKNGLLATVLNHGH